MAVVLHQFRSSHFNEKVRWALELKGLVHERKSYLPGPHMLAIRRLSGQTQTPVLELGGEVVAGSAAILQRIEARCPSPPLYPADPSARDAALGYQRRFDAEVGPAVRTALFSVLVDEGSYVCRIFARGQPPLRRWLYRATFPLARGLIAKGNGVVDPANVERAFALTARTLDEVAKQTADSGYLVGDTFTIADLTAAALLAPLGDVDHPEMAKPRPLPDAVARFLARYSDHAAIGWVRTMYARHRPRGG